MNALVSLAVQLPSLRRSRRPSALRAAKCGVGRRGDQDRAGRRRRPTGRRGSSRTRRRRRAASIATLRPRPWPTPSWRARRPTIVYPADGKLMGDWKKGEALAQSGYGGRFTDYPPRAENGGNCYACHQLDAKELSFGTLGPSLLEYGKNRKFAEAEVKAVYERIYNPQAAIPCANMPRLGASKFLTVEQIKDLVALVMSPESPVNK